MRQDVRVLDVIQTSSRNIIDVAAFSGTMTRMQDERPITAGSVMDGRVYHWGNGNGTFTNRHAGVTMWAGKKFSRSNVCRLVTTPVSLQGRGAAMRMKKGPFVSTMIGVYFPPMGPGVCL